MPVRGFNAFSRGANLLCSTKKGRITPLVQQAYLAPYDSWEHRIAVQRFVQDIPLAPGDRSWRAGAADLGAPRVARLDADAHLLGPEGLRLRRRTSSPSGGGGCPSAQVHVFEDAGHYVLEDAHEEIVPLMRQFLSANPLS